MDHRLGEPELNPQLAAEDGLDVRRRLESRIPGLFILRWMGIKSLVDAETGRYLWKKEMLHHRNGCRHAAIRQSAVHK